jgi:hypothetical protein
MNLLSLLRSLLRPRGGAPRPDDLVRLTHAASEPEGEAWVELLHRQGIRAMGRRTGPYGALGAASGSLYPFEVWVLRRDYVRAATFLGLHPDADAPRSERGEDAGRG